MNVRELMAERAALISRAGALVDGAEAEGRDLSAEENAQYEAIMAEVRGMDGRIGRQEEQERRAAQLAGSTRRGGGAERISDEQYRRDEVAALGMFIRTGRMDGLLDLRASSNDTDMNVTTTADGGAAVPLGHYNNIIAKRNEGALFPKLGCLPIPGLGTTVKVPIETGVANEFVSTNEGDDQDRDAPVLDTADMTLVDFTKDVELTTDLLEDTDTNILAFVENYVGRALAKTHNKACITECLANGTAVTLGDDTTATATDVATMIYALPAWYADNAKWVLGRATEGKYRALTGNYFQFAPMGASLSGVNDPLWNYPVFYSDYVPAIGAGNKSLIFGNHEYCGMREGQLNFLRDPYSLAKKRKVALHYYARIVYKVLNAEAILYGRHPTA